MTVLITGASSGIGEALAVECARRGDALFLCGRNEERLNAVARKCRELGAFVRADVVDVRDERRVREWMHSCDAERPLERVFSNAGVATGAETEENVRTSFAINVDGGVNVVLTAIELFSSRQLALGNRGERDADVGRNGKFHNVNSTIPKFHNSTIPQILITASIAGYGPLAGCPAYSATKACMKTWALALRGMLAPEGIRVSAICPGFVRSRITDRNTCPMPFFMEADRAAKIILARADRNVGLIAFPWPMRLATWLLSILPYRLNELIVRLIPAPKKRR